MPAVDKGSVWQGPCKSRWYSEGVNNTPPLHVEKFEEHIAIHGEIFNFGPPYCVRQIWFSEFGRSFVEFARCRRVRAHVRVLLRLCVCRRRLLTTFFLFECGVFPLAPSRSVFLHHPDTPTAIRQKLILTFRFVAFYFIFSSNKLGLKHFNSIFDFSNVYKLNTWKEMFTKKVILE